MVPKLRPAGRIRPTKTFYSASRALLKNICTYYEPQLDRIMSGILQFQFFYLFMLLENTPRLWEENSEIRHRIEVKTFVFFSFSLSPAEVQKILYTAPCSKSLGTTANAIKYRCDPNKNIW